MAAQLVDLGNVTRVSERVVRVLGQNPGKFTLQGTNTYIIGSQNPYILIDTAQGFDSYIPILSSALTSTAQPSNPTLPDVSDIIISHWHLDHVGGIPSVLKLLKELWEARNAGVGGEVKYVPPRLHKYPIPEGSNGAHTTAEHFHLPRIVGEIQEGSYTPAPDGGVFHDLSDGHVFNDTQSGDPSVQVVHTPGHTVDSIALYIPQDKALYTADTVLGHGTAVFEDLGVYLKSLQRMLDLDGYDDLYPGHGAVVTQGRDTIATYIKHRLERESEIVKVLQTKGISNWTTWNIVGVIYKSYPESLWLPASRSVDLHLSKLESDGVVKRIGGEGVGTEWEWLAPVSSL